MPKGRPFGRPFGVCYLDFFLVDSLTVVRGLLRTVDCFTKRPVIALRPRWPAVMLCFAMPLTPSG